ncbi:MAG TPA: glycosyltransferase family 4 protein [Dermatophilaceae bacterium]|nr:glycosyltransferase family 4 protein [Dermatophilaceae bacterium]
MPRPVRVPSVGREQSSHGGALRLAVVGPTHPYKGGVATHTTTLAHHLASSGHDVTLVSWSHLYPSRLYPGEQLVPGGTPDVEPFPRTIRALSWARPDTWVRAGRRLRRFDAVVIVHVIPAVVPAHLALLRAAGVGSRAAGVGSRAVGVGSRGARNRAGSAGAPRAIVIAHNVLPHEPHLGDAALMRALFARADAVLVHGPAQSTAARSLGASRVAVAELPPHLPGGVAADRAPYAGPARLLALGMVRDYKGVDVLVKALAQVPDLTLTIAGELWGESGRRVQALAADPRVKDRVTVQAGYVPADQLAQLLARHDVLALTYRSATASQNALLGHAHGLPVLASDVGTFGADVRDGVDGLLVPPGDEAALVSALQRLRQPELLRRLKEGVHPPDLSTPWAHYLLVLESLATPSLPAAPIEELTEPPGAGADGDGSGAGGSGAGGSGAGGSGAGGSGAGETGAGGSGAGGSGAGGSGAGGSGAGERGAGGSGAGGSGAGGTGPALATGLLRRVAAVAHRVLAARQPRLELGRSDLPDWVRPTDVLADAADADEARDWARSFGLPRCGDSVAAWAALGALAALVRLADDGRRLAVVVDESGTRSPMARWARSVGFAPVELGFTGARSSVAAIGVDPGTLDVITRLHPGGCDADDVQEAMRKASWALRPGGLLSLTLPLGPTSAQGAVGPAEVRGVQARAGELGFVLVGDLDGDVTARMRQASIDGVSEQNAYALVRLTFRRR